MGRRSRKNVWGGLGLGLAWAVWRVAVLLDFKAQGIGLVSEAAQLPREYAVGAGRPLRMVVLGDSTAAGVGASRLETTLPYRVALELGRRVAVTNLAVSGATLLDVVDAQLSKVPSGADLVLVSVTANDATKGTSPSDVEHDLRSLLTHLRERGAKRAVLSTTPNFRTTPALPLLLNGLFERRAAALTRAIREVAATHPEAGLADLNRDGTLSEVQYAADGFHPNDAGYAVWVESFVRAAKS